MRKFFTWLILAFARTVTLGLSPTKRRHVLMRVRDRLPSVFLLSTRSANIRLFDNNYLVHKGLTSGAYVEPDTLDWIDAMSEDGCLWDIGANIGVYTLSAASRLRGDDVRVVAFEPAAANFGALNRNIELNGAADHVVAYCIALAGETKIGRLNMGEKGLGTLAGSCFNGFETEIHIISGRVPTQFRQGAVGFRIDDFVEMFQPPLPTHVKLDVDNIEAAILRGGRRTLSAHSVQSVIMEMEGDLNSDHNQELFGVMAELGFAPRPKQSPELRNVIFERPV